MAETVTNLISQVSLESNWSIINNEAVYQYVDMIHLTENLVVSAYGDEVNNIGAIKVAVKTSLNCMEWGTAQTFLSGNRPLINKLVRLSNTEFLIIYKNNADNKGYVRHGTVDSVNKTVTFGTVSSAFSTGAISYLSAAYIDANLAIITFDDGGVSNKGHAIMASNSSGTISFGSAVIFNNATTTYNSVCKLTTTSAFVCFSNGSTNGQGLVISLSGTTITTPINSPAIFNAANTSWIKCDAVSSTSVIVAYNDVGNSNTPTTCVCTISGTTITWGSEYGLGSYIGNSTPYCNMILLSSNKFIIFGNDGSSVPCMTTGKISGTTVTLYGNPVRFFENSNAPTALPSVCKIDESNAAFAFYSATYFLSVYGTITVTGSIPEVNSMCKLLATGKSGGHTEISSIYFVNTKGSFEKSTFVPKLFLNGTDITHLFSVPFRANYSGETAQTCELLIPNSPIILTDGDDLYVSAYSIAIGDYPSYPINAVLFGIDVVTS